MRQVTKLPMKNITKSIHYRFVGKKPNFTKGGYYTDISPDAGSRHARLINDLGNVQYVEISNLVAIPDYSKAQNAQSN